MTGIVMAMALTVAAAASAAPAIQSDAAGNRIEPFESVPVAPAAPNSVPDGQPQSPEILCLRDRTWCAKIVVAEIKMDGAELQLFDGRDPSEARRLTSIALPGDGDVTYELWPAIVREAPRKGESADSAVIIAARAQRSTMYSGGGANAERLMFFRIVGDQARPVLEVDEGASKMIRACFSEKDMKDRRGACHDEYMFSATITLVPTTPAGMPVFRYVTNASDFPAGSSQDQDSSARGRLKKSDIRTVVDPECSYQRVIRLNPPTQRYEFDTPGPDCSDFTDL